MLDAQNQGPQRTACDSPMKLTVIEPRRGGEGVANVCLLTMQKSSAAHH